MTKERKNKIKGCIFGFAIGDSMGATTEFMTEKQIKNTFGKVDNIIGGGVYKWLPGEVTDDTQMTLCVIDALMNGNKNDSFGFSFMEYLRQSFISWYDSKPKGIGIRCKKAIEEMKNKNKLAASKDGNALGNGGLMRAMPCAITNNLLLNTLQSRMTHDNDICTQTIIIYQDAIKDYLDNNYVNDYNLELLKPLGHVTNTLNNALYWSQSNTFEEAIVGAVNHGGDADTIAAIAGSLAGAKFGYDKIPERWINQLNSDVKEKLEKFYKFVIKTLDI